MMLRMCSFTLLRQNAPRLAVGMNGEESPPKLWRSRAKGYGEFRHPFQDAPPAGGGPRGDFTLPGRPGLNTYFSL
jgi:hypothetical protein